GSSKPSARLQCIFLAVSRAFANSVSVDSIVIWRAYLAFDRWLFDINLVVDMMESLALEHPYQCPAGDGVQTQPHQLLPQEDC
ncbi:hypothetical protein ACV357_34455, partial [Pseudomonas aeruginosa]